jgi:hypothetical protein
MLGHGVKGQAFASAVMGGDDIDGWLDVCGRDQRCVNLRSFGICIQASQGSPSLCSKVTYASEPLQGQWTLKQRLADRLQPTRLQEQHYLGDLEQSWWLLTVGIQAQISLGSTKTLVLTES